MKTLTFWEKDPITHARLLFLLLLGQLAPAVLHAQLTISQGGTPTSATVPGTVASLAGSDGLLPNLAVPASLLSSAKGTANWYVQSASVLLVAADLAKHNRFPTRHGQLLLAAEQNLLGAKQAGFATERGHANCAYLLGYLAERLHNDVPAAEAYYEEAVAADPKNTQAANALARTKAVLAFRASLAR
jgi:hypothetical protein